MAVLVNMKICDNADVCSGVEVCPTGAIYWNEEKQTLDTDNNKCMSCGVCESSCPAGAIVVAHDEEEFRRYEKRIKEDPRTISGLFVERYGASPINESLQLPIQKIDEVLANISGIVAVEIIDDMDTDCLINSVPISDILSENMYTYYKISTNDSDYPRFAEAHSIKEIPSLLLFKNKVLKLKIDGSVNNNNQEAREDFIKKVRDNI